MAKEINLSNTKYWKGKIYPSGKQWVPDDLAEFLGIPSNILNTTITTSATDINTRLSNIEATNRAIRDTLQAILGKLNYADVNITSVDRSLNVFLTKTNPMIPGTSTRDASLPAYDTMQVGGMYVPSLKPAIYGNTENTITCNAVTSLVDLHNTANYGKLSPKLNNNEGYRLKLPCNKLFSLYCSYKKGVNDYNLNFGIYGSGNGWTMMMDDVSTNTGWNVKPLVFPDPVDTIVNNATANATFVLEIGILKGKWLLAFDGKKVEPAPELTSPDVFPIEILIAPKVVGMTVTFERINYK